MVRDPENIGIIKRISSADAATRTAIPSIEHPPIELTPIELTPIELTPIELTPIELTPIELQSIELTPIALTPIALTSTDVDKPPHFDIHESRLIRVQKLLKF